MNHTAYIFKEISSNYTQFPEDSSSELFKSICRQCEAPTQIIAHRDGSLMYYIYVRRLHNKSFIGFALIINGYYLTDFKRLFSICEKEIERLSETGVTLQFSDDGRLIPSAGSLLQEEEEVESVVWRLQRAINSMPDFRTLPPEDYAVSKVSKQIFKANDDANLIAESSYRLGYTIILKEEDFNTIRVNCVSNILSALNDEKNRLLKQTEALKEANKKISRQKNQFLVVTLLLIILLATGTGLLILNKDLNHTKDRLDATTMTLNEKELDLLRKQSALRMGRDSIRRLKIDLRREQTARQTAEKSLQDIFGDIPFVVTKCEEIAGQLHCDYYAAETKDLTLELSVINTSNGQIITSDHQIEIVSGYGTFILNTPSSQIPHAKYAILISYDHRVVASIGI